MGRKVESQGKRNPLRWTELEHLRQHNQDRLRQVTNNLKIETQKLLQIINITVGTGSSAEMSYEPMTDVAVQNFR